ncbi:erythrocyte binding protein [Pelomyxa schiedti]|nr:erythrocyte binding protein [Pelomyxa schiedti]
MWEEDPELQALQSYLGKAWARTGGTLRRIPVAFPSDADLLSEQEEARASVNPDMTSKEVSDWIKGMNTRLTGLTKPPPSNRLLVNHLADVLQVRNHRLHDALHRTIDETKRFLATCNDVGSDKAAPVVQENINKFTDSVLDNVLQVYRPLKTVESWARFSVKEVILNNVFGNIWPKYISKYSTEDRLISTKSHQFQHVNLRLLSVPKKFWIIDPNTLTPSTPIDSLPYSAAIKAAQKISTMETPATKIACLKQIGTSITDALCKASSSKIVLGADDVLPIYSYVLIKACILDAHSESKFMEHFLSESETSDESGYLVVMFQTVLNFISSLKEEDLDKTGTKKL